MDEFIYDEDSGMEISPDGMIFRNSMYRDEHGRPVERTPDKYPYSYDGYVTWRGGENSEVNSTIYSDRLSQWDYDKCKNLKLKYFGKTGDWWSSFDPKQIEAFLREWCEDPELKLIFIMQYCNASSGYPVWRFDFQTKKVSQ